MRQPLFSLRLPLVTLLALSPVAGYGQQQPAEPGPGVDRQVGQWVDPCLRLRSGASLDHPILDCLEPGTRLRVLGEISGWSQVRLLDGTEGWVDSGFLEALATAPAPRPAAAAPEAAPRPAASAAAADALGGQIAALEGQLEAMAALRAATEERLRRTVAAAEQAQIEAGRLSERVRELERQREATESDHAERLAAELEAGQARIAELEQALTAAEGQLLRAAQLNAEQERRIEALDATQAAGHAREAELRQELAAAEARAQAAEENGRSQETRIAQLEAELPASRERENELSQALAAAEAQAASSEDARQALVSRIAELQAELQAVRGREAALGDDVARLAARLEAAEETAAAEPAAEPAGDPAASAGPAAEPPTAGPGPALVREPIVTAPQPPPVAVRRPLAMEPAEEEAEAAAPEPGDATLPGTEAAMDTVRAWAAAWSDQRVEDYLAFYASGFRPANGLGRAAWEAKRTERLTRPSYIRVTISSLGAERAPDGTVRATFRQDYESDTFTDTVTKVLILAEQDGAWRILAERAEP